MQSAETKRAYGKTYRASHKIEARAYAKKYFAERPGLSKEINKRNIVKIRNETFSAYGARCNCCGERNPLFLTIDHVNNDGATHRHELFGKRWKGHGGGSMYRWLKKNGFPKDRFQLLCFNCNCGRQRNGGVCPHLEPV